MINEKERRFEAIVLSLHTDLYRYACWLTNDKSSAENILQETFLRAWRALDSLKDDKAAKSWLITILRRENARRFERKQFDLVDLEDVSVSADVDQDNDAEIRQVRRAMSKLAPNYREPLVLQIIFGFNIDEIAQHLALNKNTVMTRLFRARNQLQEMLLPQTQKECLLSG